jgi:hypothetical protein
LLLPIDLHQLHLAHKTHGRLQRLGVVQADGVAEGGQEASSEELDALSFVEAARSRQERLESVGVLLHRARVSALGELKERGRVQGRPETQV